MKNAAAARHERYEYLSNERSDRTGGHVLDRESLWRLHRAACGLLLAIDGKPLPPDRMQQERARLQKYS